MGGEVGATKAVCDEGGARGGKSTGRQGQEGAISRRVGPGGRVEGWVKMIDGTRIRRGPAYPPDRARVGGKPPITPAL